MKTTVFHLTLAFIFGAWMTAYAHQEEIVARETLLHQNWQIQQSSKINQNGDILSTNQAITNGWYPATVPSTVMGTLTRNGQYKDLLIGTNYKQADRSPFNVSWWYRTQFNLPALKKGQHVSLQFDGLTYRANIWLNGKQFASKDEVFGPFCRFSFDITQDVEENNVLAVEIFRAQAGEPNIGFVDWNPRPLDENMGLFREVKLAITGDLEIKNTRIQSRVNTKTLDEAWLTIETEVSNLADKKLDGRLNGQIEQIRFSVPVTLEAGETKTVRITPEEVKTLHFIKPRLWWCNNLGSPELYTLDLNFQSGDIISDREEIIFGIRQIETYLTEKGHKGFILNGEKVLIKSAGWTDDIFLRDTPESNELQIQYVKDMNLNSIRFENIWGSSRNIYDLCDRYGILALVGWSCQWEWEVYIGTPHDEYGCIRSVEDFNLLTRYLNDQVLWLRNHPSIIAWFGGSDKLLRPELEKRYMELLPKIDDRPYIGAAKGLNSTVTGHTGMKMFGPYEYVGPNYWFIDSVNGGAYGFNTETGPGPQVPVYESILKMIPKDKLWPINETWNYHCTTASDVLNSLDILNKAMEAKFGKPSSLSDYLRKAHLMNYKSTKAMFEAFRINKPEATGVVMWMLNSAWPSLYWQLYDYYMIPVPAYYGVKKANNPQQLIYNYKDNGIYAVNETLSDASSLKAVIQGFSIDSKTLYKEEKTFSINANSAQQIFTIDNSTLNSFVSLKLYDKNGLQLADNFYSLSSKQDVYDWGKTDWVGSPMTAYSDFNALSSLPESSLKINLTSETKGDQVYILIKTENTSPVIAFFTNFVLKDDNGERVYPVYWDDNYVSLLPGEQKTLKCRVAQTFSANKTLTLYVSGWNVKEQIIELQ